MVVNPIVGGPSEMQGIKAGDKIVKINDTLVVGIGIQNNNVLSKLRGSKGSKVKLSIKRFGQKELINFYIVRDKIPLHSIEVAYMIDAEKGYIKINSFGANTYQEFKDKVSLLQKKGMKKLLIDLRQNGGGYLDASIQIADEIIGGSPLLVYTEGAHYPRQDYFASHTGIFENGTIGVILDEGSASASEILSGAIQDLDRGVIIGRRSFGKGLVMSDIQLMDGSSLRLSMAHYFTPSGRCVQKHYTNDILAYETEIFQRFFNQPTKIDSIDSIKNSKNYFTKKGKIVKGGGGIYPDIFVPVDTNYDLRAYAELRSDVPEFIYQQMPNIKEHISTFKTVEEFQKGFVIDMNLYQKFTQYLKEHKNPGLGKIVPLEPKIKIIMKAYIARQLWNNEGFYRIVNDMDKTYETAVKSI